MKINKKFIIGSVLVMAGAAIIDFVIIKHLSRKDALPNELFGFAIIGLGVYFISKGKKQQRQERQNDNN